MADRDGAESTGGSGSDRDNNNASCFPKVQSIVANLNTPSKTTKVFSSIRGTPASSTTSRRHQPSRFAKAMPCLQPVSSQSSVNTIGSASKILDPVQVYCRVRPLDNEESCVSIKDNKSIVISPPDSAAWRQGFSKALTYTFEQVFNGETNQQTAFDEIALPLVKDFLQAKNSLLFAYGITGSGKTYTMSGTPAEPGIMPRCLDVIFNSISDVKAMRHIFKSDHLNGFEALSKAEAMLARQNVIASANVPKTPGRTLRNGRHIQVDTASNFTSQRAYDTTVLPVVNKDSVYSVFITYIEIYNNIVYDLLDDSPDKPTSKMLREDANHNVYVHSVCQVEVQSADEAFDVFNRGQRQRRIAHTTLNTESSRSHSIFNIRLVQAPVDEEGEIIDQKMIAISQLSLVDLAGSERYGRTGATGDRLKEAGSINNSLMMLRKCMDVLRENQRTSSNKIIPYRDTKVTHFLKNFFEGEGRVRMVLCINPRAVDYDENLHVLTFAELTKEVQVARPTPAPSKETVTPLPKRKAVEVQKIVKRRLIEVNENDQTVFQGRSGISVGFDFELGPALPIFKIIRSDEEHILTNLREAMESRIKNRVQLHSTITAKRDYFRSRLIAMERTLETMKLESQALQTKFGTVSDERDSLENVLRTVQFEKAELDMKIEEQEREIVELREKLEDCQMETRQREVTHLKDQERLKSDLERERELDERRRSRLLQKEEAKLKAEFKEKEKTIEAVRQLVSQVDMSAGDISRRSRSKRSIKNHDLSTSSESDIPSAVERTHEFANTRRVSSVAKIPLDSPSRYRKGGQTSSATKYRSRSTENDKWLEHASGVGVCQGTVFQPVMRHKKSVNQLINPADITHNTTKYCLKTQQLDSEGEVETLLVKGDVMPTAGGGAQVVFTDAETLKQVSPDRALSPSRKRASASTTITLTPSKYRNNDHGDDLTMTQTLGLGHFSGNKRSRQHHD